VKLEDKQHLKREREDDGDQVKEDVHILHLQNFILFTPPPSSLLSSNVIRPQTLPPIDYVTTFDAHYQQKKKNCSIIAITHSKNNSLNCILSQIFGSA
jgi:uncharacterized membrane protein